MQVVIEGQAIHYQKTGNGRCIIFVHGWGDDLNSFHRLQSELTNEFSVVTLDLPGFGQSESIDRAWDLSDYAKCLSNFVQKLKLDVYAYIGHSNGGAILIYGLAHGELIAKNLILLSSAGIRNQKVNKKLLIKLTAKSGKATTTILPKGVQRTIRSRFYNVVGSEMLLLPNMESTFKKIVNHDVQDDAAKLDLPTLLIYGRDDKATPLEFAKIFNSLIKKSRLEIIDNAGHFVHHDSPTKVLGFIEEFLK